VVRLMVEDILQVVHPHVIFTLDEGLRIIFLRHREMLKSFMDEAVKLIQQWFKKKFKVVPGITAGLHTFGSRINFNPHIHMLVTMGRDEKNGEWKVYDYIPFLKYIGRYIRRPAIALHRIEKYDGELVTFRYYDKTEQRGVYCPFDSAHSR
jgi:hypothetical protein